MHMMLLRELEACDVKITRSKDDMCNSDDSG